MNFERSSIKTVPEKIGIGVKTPVEIIDTWNRQIRGHAPFSFKDGKMTIPIDWDQIKDENEPQHIFLIFEMIKGGRNSDNVAIWIDDNINGWFTYRDWTKDGLPFVNEGDIYWSGFTFQKLEDAKKVFNKFGGSGNWMNGHKEFVEKINNDRNER